MMRKLLLFALLTSVAAVPSVAGPDERGEDVSARSEMREERREERQAARQAERAERVERVERVERSPSEAADLDSGRSGNRRTDRAASAERPAHNWEAAREAAEEPAPRREREAGDTVRAWRRAERHRPDSPTVVQEANDADSSERLGREGRRFGGSVEAPRIGRDVPTTPTISGRNIRRLGNNVPIEGTAPPPPSRDALARSQVSRHWRTDWRRDRRYDWRDWRRRNRSRFHFGFYFDPFGWDYRRYSIGWRLWPSYYSNRYWLNDPWHWRLPPAYGPYRWIRYHDDALMVNIYTGEVVDVIYNFFW